MRKLIIEERQFNMLFELNNNLKFRDVDRDIKSLGFDCRRSKGGYIYQNDSGATITVHTHGENAQAKAETLGQVITALTKCGWFKDEDNVQRTIPILRRWGYQKKAIQNIINGLDTTEDDIKAANEEYADATVTPIFSMANSVCALETSEGVNLCRSSADRRPLLDFWYHRILYPVRGNRSIPCLVYDNEESWQSECYPINKDGTLDYDNVIIENKKYGKSRIW